MSKVPSFASASQENSQSHADVCSFRINLFQKHIYYIITVLRVSRIVTPYLGPPIGTFPLSFDLYSTAKAVKLYKNLYER